MPVIASKKNYTVVEGATTPLLVEGPAVFVPNEEDKALLEAAKEKAENEVITATKESEAALAKAQLEANTKIAEAKAAAQKLIDDAKADYENRKAIFEKYDYNTVNEALKTKYFENQSIPESEVPEGGYFNKPEEISKPIETETYQKKLTHPLLRYMKG